MNCRSRFLIFLVIFNLTARCTPAQQTELEKKPLVGAEHTADRGVLLGLYFPKHASWDDLPTLGPDEKRVPEISNEPNGRYLTFWISRRGGEVKIQATESLLVPRANEFWHIGTQIVKSDHQPEFSYEERLWALPVGNTLKPAQADPQIDGASVRLITYVGPHYVGYLFRSRSGGWEYSYPHIASLDDLATDLSIEKVLGPAADAEFKRLAKSLDHMSDGTDVCNCCTNDENEWGILNEWDSWQVFARFHYGTSSSCSQGWEDRALEAAIPKSLAVNGTAHTSWARLRDEADTVVKGKPGSVRHLFVSPKQDLAVAVGLNGLAVLDVKNLHVTSVLKVQPFEAACIPVMEQWAVGRFVRSWDAAVQKEHPATVLTENP